MPLTIAVANLKGGVGKSTVTLNVATCLHRAGHRVLLVDADGQGTCRAWAAVAASGGKEGPAVVGLSGPGLRRDLEAVGSGFDVVVVDTPPRLGVEAKTAMLVADLVVMPVTPGAADVWALAETVAALTEARQLRPELRARALLNRADRTTLAKLARGALAELGVEVLGTTLGARVAFGEATLAGQGVVDYAPTSVAAAEVRAMTSALLALFEEESDGKKGSGARVQPAQGAGAHAGGRAKRGAVRQPRGASGGQRRGRP